jgi:hypothetical protein
MNHSINHSINRPRLAGVVGRFGADRRWQCMYRVSGLRHRRSSVIPVSVLYPDYHDVILLPLSRVGVCVYLCMYVFI